MAIIHGTTQTESTSTEEQSPDREGGSDGILGRMSSLASKVSDVIDPFVNVLTLLVHGFTVYELARKA